MPEAPDKTNKPSHLVRVILAILALLALLFSAASLSQYTFWREKTDTNTLHLSGNIEAHESVLSFKTVQSRITNLPFNEGQTVRKGEVLAVLDDADYRQQVTLAQANLAVQQRLVEAAQQNWITTGQTLLVDQAQLKQQEHDWQRAHELQQQGFFSSAQLEQSSTVLKQAQAVLARDQSVQTAAKRSVELAQAGVHQAQASIALAQLVLGYTRLLAPFDGVITLRKAELGEVVVPGTPVLTLADLDHVWLRAYLNETDLGRVRLGQEVTVSHDSQPGKHYAGRISFIADKAEFTPKSVETHAERVSLVYRVKIDIENPNHELVTGMPADAKIMLKAAAT